MLAVTALSSHHAKGGLETCPGIGKAEGASNAGSGVERYRRFDRGWIVCMTGPITSQHEFSLTDPLFFGNNDPEDILRILRRDDPVHWTRGRLSRGFWSLTRHEDCRFIYANDRGEDALFSSRRWGPMIPVGLDWENPVEGDLMSLFQAGGQLSSMDGDRHTVLRSAFSKMFTPGEVSKLEAKIRELAIEALNAVLPCGECDFAADVAGVLPLTLISHIMGVPREDWDALYRWTYMTTAPEDPEFNVGDPAETSRIGTKGLTDYCLKLALERRERPGDDLLSVLGAARIDGKLLSNIEVGFNGLAFYSAGHETTRNALCGGLEHLLGAGRDEWDRMRGLRQDPRAMTRLADEMVRWSTPLTHQMRTATRDLEIGGKMIREDDWIVMWNNSANRDEAVFDDPYRFDGSRSPNPHLGFAYGAHFCLGAHLARLEMRVMLELLLEYLPDMQLVGGSEFAASLIFRGIKRQPVTFAPRELIKV